MKRTIDEVGRVVIPVEWRRSMGIDVFNKDEVVMEFDGEKITMYKAMTNKETIRKEIERLEKILEKMEDNNE